MKMNLTKNEIMKMNLTKNEIKSLKAQAQLIKPKILVGKNGLTDGTLQSIDED